MHRAIISARKIPEAFFALKDLKTQTCLNAGKHDSLFKSIGSAQSGRLQIADGKAYAGYVFCKSFLRFSISFSTPDSRLYVDARMRAGGTHSRWQDPDISGV
jgi:hypothetical protein